jgi:enoyl-CoA hydratase/carnithine racemase
VARTLGNCLSAANYARFLDLLGPTRLKELLYTGRLLSADEAMAAGLVNRIVERAHIDQAVRDLALTIAANAPLTVKATKEMICRIQRHRRIEAVEGRDLIVMCYTSADFREGVDAFLTKRRPRWQGV